MTTAKKPKAWTSPVRRLASLRLTSAARKYDYVQSDKARGSYFTIDIPAAAIRATNARVVVFPSSSFSSSLGFSAQQRAGAKTFARDATSWQSSFDDQITGWKMKSTRV